VLCRLCLVCIHATFWRTEPLRSSLCVPYTSSVRAPPAPGDVGVGVDCSTSRHGAKPLYWIVQFRSAWPIPSYSFRKDASISGDNCWVCGQSSQYSRKGKSTCSNLASKPNSFIWL